MVTRTTMDGNGARYPLDVVEVDHTPLNCRICDRTGLPLGRQLPHRVMIDAYRATCSGPMSASTAPDSSSVSGAVRCAIEPRWTWLPA